MGLGYLFAGKFGGIKVKEVEGENTPCWNIMVNTTLKIDFSRRDCVFTPIDAL